MHSPKEEEEPPPLSAKAAAAISKRKRKSEAMDLENANTFGDYMELHHDQRSGREFNFQPRQYQVKVFEVAKRRNTIAHLDTGAGKTMIAVMMIQHIADTLITSSPKKLAIFLAPTVHLVHQQYEVIKSNTELKIEEYYGAKGVDEWTAEMWANEVNEHHVLVMTPQILLDALRKAFLNMQEICLLILDECHRATGNHPYTRIMQEFYHKGSVNPKVFGMTASPVIRKGVASMEDCEQQISELEGIMDARIYTVENKKEIEEFIPSAQHICRFYNQTMPYKDLKAKLEASWLKFLKQFDSSLLDLQGSLLHNYQDIDDKHKLLRKRLSSDHSKILHCLEHLGPICAYEAVNICIENSANSKDEFDFVRASTSQCKLFLGEVLFIIEESLPQGHEELLNVCTERMIATEYISSKLYELLQIFQSLGGSSQVLCLIFVERIITAKVIERIVKKITSLSHFTVSYLTGSNTSMDGLAPKVQKEVLDSFRSGKVNLLFATDVVEEGIHVPNCSCVIRFDLPKTVRSYVQSRGRARQSDSKFVVMLERGNQKQRDQMFDIIRSEYSMAALNRDPDAFILKACNIKETETYYVDATGASVTADSSVSLIHKYCAKLPGDKYFSPKPNFQYLLRSELYECKLTLPPNAAFQTITGPLCRSTVLSRQLVCLAACKKLHEMGALNDNLLPLNEESEENDSTVKSKELYAGAGTTKRKELHGTTQISALFGTWLEKHDGATFYAYKFDFSCNIPDIHYSSFILLTESKLDDDVGNFEVELYLLRKFVKAHVSSCGQLHLNAEQVAMAKCFQELFFNGMFGKLFIGSKETGKREFLLQTDELLWNPSNLYLLLPLDIPIGQAWRISWCEIESSVSVVDFLKKKPSLAFEHSLHNGRADSSDTSDLIHLANKSLNKNNLKEVVVLAIHTGRIYSILEAQFDTSAETPFDGDTSTFSSFADYFNKKYGIVLTQPGQPLLLLKQTHNAHNLLVDFRNEVASSGKEKQIGSKGTDVKERSFVRMPPELLVSIDVRIDVQRSFYLLPSLMHRMESLMLASQLREEINRHSGNLHISSSLILEALTTLRCSESFSMERLELLGDSVLKYAVSCHLFLKYSKKHEGQLSSRRSWAVCNSTLHRLGVDRNIQGYIRDSAFEPRRWTAPGQLSTRLFPCKHDLDTLEVPLDSKYRTEDTEAVVGKCCDKGHRWMGSKTISDCVEALIGAYYVGGGLVSALQLMKWLDIEAELDPSLLEEAINAAALHVYSPKLGEIEALESKLGYIFSVKGLLLEAITHASDQGLGVGYCYQRLEFLGDSVLDILITLHLYESHKDIDPGELTDLRSASVNNETFANAAVRRNLYPHLQHCSGFLLNQIQEFVDFVSGSSTSMKTPQGSKGPKVLGDLVESIAGAILIDTKLNLDEVWRIFKPLLSPIVTPDKLELPPLRELIELCDRAGYFIKETCTTKGDAVHAELRVQLKDALLVRKGFGNNKKVAKGQAAVHLLKDLETRGISKRRKLGSDNYICSKTGEEDPSEPIHKRQNITQPQNEPPLDPISKNGSAEVCEFDLDIPVLEPINLKKGGPRTSLYALCKKLQWPMPKFDTTENKSRTAIELDDGDGEKRMGFSSFISKINLTIPNFGVMEVTGDPRADKKSSFDSAALQMLYELEQQRKLVIGKD